MRILFISTEVAPFAKETPIADLIRKLPELLNDHTDSNYDIRIIMPRYGSISERRNRLHEVIRLSGAEVSVGDRKETIKVKVASIPGIRLQVYFTDNVYYLKRRGIYQDNRTEKVFADNEERAIFFGRAALATTQRLGWQPDVVHASGWMSGFIPMLLKSEFATDDLFKQAKVVFTPDKMDVAVSVTEEMLENFNLSEEQLLGKTLSEIGIMYADAVGFDKKEVEAYLEDENEDLVQEAINLYDEALQSKNVLA